MSFILISNTSDSVINSNLIRFISEEIKKICKADINFKELSINKAYECFISPNKLSDQLSKFINKLKKQHKLDINLIDSQNIRRKKLLLADMDSTIIKEESLDELAKLIGKEKEIVLITKNAMEGKIDFKKALFERVSMLKGTPFDILDNLKTNVRINEGASELIKTMKHNGAITVLVSGGFTFLTNYLKDKLGFDFVHANYLQYSIDKTGNMILNGKVSEPILDKEAKLKYLNKYLCDYTLNPNDTICVGDGANDIDMIVKSGMGVSFNGKRALKDLADLHFEHTNLLGLLYAQGYSDAEIIS